MERRLVATPKSFFVKERDQFYSEWTLSFWREFFQNSVDAGSKNIRIDLEAAKGRGSFDEIGDSGKQVTRVVFEDDGCGMNAEVLDKVYFAIGQTTKEDGTSVGGYGRARLMTCFSQARYSILTTDRFVMGDGPDYVNYSLDEAEEALSKAIAALPEAGSDDEALHRAVSVDGLDRDLQMVRAARAAGGFKGCRVEVDLLQERSGYQSAPDVSTMSTKLKQYLSESQIPGLITVNGKTPEDYFGIADGKLQAWRGAVKRTLKAELDGNVVEFATVHTSEGAKAHHKGKLIVRVDGASMYATGIEVDGVQVIMEIDKNLSRAVMNSNRDGLKSDFRDAVSDFIAELNVDNRSALADRKSKDNYTISGDRGMLLARVPDIREIALKSLDDGEWEAARTVAAKPQKIESLDALRSRGLTEDFVEELVRSAYYGRSFINSLRYTNFALADDVDVFLRAVADTYNDEKPVDVFLEHASDRLKEWLVRTVSARTDKSLAEIGKKNVERLKDMNDVHVSIISANDRTRAAIRRNDPRKWDVAEGRGRAPRALLSAWTAACSVAVEALLKLRPSTDEFSWTTGWVFSVPEETQQGDRYRAVSVEAMCQTERGVRRFLLNPVDQDGTLRYSVSDSRDRQRLQALAMHEVAHVLEDYHNETYAGILTDLMKEFDTAAANRRMKDAVRAVMAAYEAGRARIQAMDSEHGPRPSERLMALASGNDPDSAGAAVERNEDGTWTVDSDRLQDHVVPFRPRYELDEIPSAMAAAV